MHTNRNGAYEPALISAWIWNLLVYLLPEINLWIPVIKLGNINCLLIDFPGNQMRPKVCCNHKYFNPDENESHVFGISGFLVIEI